MLDKIEGVTGKSFDGSNLNLPLKNVNIFFGMNGAGKSGLAKWLYSQMPGGTRLFDTDYVNKKIRVQDNINNIKGVHLLTGAGIQTADDIKRAEEDITAKEQGRERKQSELEKNKDILYKQMQSLFEQGKNKFPGVKIQQKPNAKTDPQKAFELWEKEGERQSVKDQEADIKVTDSSEIEREIELLEGKRRNLPIRFSQNDISAMKDDLPVLLSTAIIAPPESEGLTSILKDWLKEGLTLHNKDIESQKCHFCGNEFNTAAVFEAINKTVSTKYAEHISRLSKMAKILKDIEENLNGIEKSGFSAHEDDSKTIQERISRIRSRIEEKKEDTQKTFGTENSNDITELLDCLLDVNQQIINRKDELSEELEKWKEAQKHQEGYAKRFIGQTIKNDQAAIMANKTCISLKNEISGLDSEIKELSGKLNTLKSQKGNLQFFADIVNSTFERSGTPFTLEPDGGKDSYIIKSTEDDHHVITLDDLSEGEVRLLGFLHFYCSLFEGKGAKTKNSKIELGNFASDVEIIVLDDPITSLDLNNRFTLIEIINDLAEKIIKLAEDQGGKIQLFVLTHSAYDFNDYAYHSNKKKISRYRIVKDLKNKSEIKSFERNTFSTYYAEQFNSVMQFALLSKKKVDQISNSVQYGNPLRFVLESHARAHYKLSTFTSNAIHDIQRYYSLEDDEIQAVKKYVDIINELSHGLSFLDESSQRMPNSEIQNAVRGLIYMLYRKDPYHIEAIYAPNKGEQVSWTKAEEQINRWAGLLEG